MNTILHITRMNFQSNKAHVYTTSKTCEALAMQDNTRVILLSSDDSLIDGQKREEFFTKHNIKNRFDIASLPSFSNRLKGSRVRLINWLETATVNFSILKYVYLNRHNFSTLYYRDCSLVLPILFTRYILKKPIFIEIHAVLHKKHGQFFNNYFSKISNGLIVISYGLKNYYEKLNKNILVAFCAASEPERFEIIRESIEQLRNRLNLPINRIILMYSGNLYKTGNYDSYGIEDIINVMPYLSSKFIFIGVGKKGNETAEHEELVKKLGISDKVMFLPWVSKQEVYEYWKSSDILLLPSAGAQIGNSPTKMFEYLASGKVIVSAKTTAIEEVLVDSKNCLLVSDYRNPKEWSEKIDLVCDNTDLRSKLISQALQDSKEFTWENRGYRINEFILVNIK